MSAELGNVNTGAGPERLRVGEMAREMGRHPVGSERWHEIRRERNALIRRLRAAGTP